MYKCNLFTEYIDEKLMITKIRNEKIPGEQRFRVHIPSVVITIAVIVYIKTQIVFQTFIKVFMKPRAILLKFPHLHKALQNSTQERLHFFKHLKTTL